VLLPLYARGEGEEKKTRPPLFLLPGSRGGQCFERRKRVTSLPSCYRRPWEEVVKGKDARSCLFAGGAGGIRGGRKLKDMGGKGKGKPSA